MSQPSQQSASSSGPSQTGTTSQTSTQPTRTQRQRTLRLRGENTATGRSVQWADDVVDNEGLGRKSSKVCCIYHKPKGVDESSDESDDSSSSSSSGEDSDAGANGKRACGHSHKKKGGKPKRAPSPNAYEKVPKQKGGTEKKG